MVQTNNSYLADKVALRANHLPPDPVRVLDCFGGSGLIWTAVQKKTGRRIAVLPIDIIDYGGFYLPGDNRSYLDSIDLSRFNVIDLDAYGIPYEQLASVFGRGFQGVVFVTFIQSVMGCINHGLLRDVGFTNAMIEKAPATLYRRGWEHFQNWLALKGVREIWHRSKHGKHYLAFQMDGQIALDIELA
jgi:hypothetical protein